jgi:hypothetical protein
VVEDTSIDECRRRCRNDDGAVAPGDKIRRFGVGAMKLTGAVAMLIRYDRLVTIDY